MIYPPHASTEGFEMTMTNDTGRPTTAAASTGRARPDRPRQRMHSGGAPLLPPTVAYAVLTVLGVVVPPLVAGVRPWSSDAALLTFFRDHAGAAHVSAYFTLGAAVPFAV
jgi:hypothetical protein